MFHGLTMLTMKEINVFCIKSWNICTYFVYYKWKKELNYVRFVDPIYPRLVHSDLQISFFLPDLYDITHQMRAPLILRGAKQSSAIVSVWKSTE